MWDLSSPTRDGTHVPELEGRFLTTGPPRKFPSFLFYSGKISQAHHFLAVASTTTLSAYCCHHLPGLLQKTPHQPPLHLVRTFWFIICIIHQWQCSLKPQAPTSNLMSLPCFKASVPKPHPQRGLLKSQMLHHGSSPRLCPTSAAFLAMAFHTSMHLCLFLTSQNALPPFLSPKVLIIWAPAPLKVFSNSITFDVVSASVALGIITTFSLIWLPQSLWPSVWHSRRSININWIKESLLVAQVFLC